MRGKYACSIIFNWIFNSLLFYRTLTLISWWQLNLILPKFFEDLLRIKNHKDLFGFDSVWFTIIIDFQDKQNHHWTTKIQQINHPFHVQTHTLHIIGFSDSLEASSTTIIRHKIFRITLTTHSSSHLEDTTTIILSSQLLLNSRMCAESKVLDRMSRVEAAVR